MRRRKRELPENAILVARNMGPAELLEYDRTRLRAIVLEEGGATAHVAIVARSLGMVAVGQAENIVSMCENGDDIIVDGPAGTVHLRPTPELEQTYVDKVRLGAKRRAHYLELKDKPSVTRDGVADHAAAQFRTGCRPADAATIPAPKASGCSAPNCSS